VTAVVVLKKDQAGATPEEIIEFLQRTHGGLQVPEAGFYR